MPSVVGAGGSHTALTLSSGHEHVAAAKAPGAGSLALRSAAAKVEASSTSHSFAGKSVGTGHVVAQSHVGGNLVLHFHDGSTITVVGAHHIDTSFIH